MLLSYAFFAKVAHFNRNSLEFQPIAIRMIISVIVIKTNCMETGNSLACPPEMDYGVRVSIGRPGIAQ